MQGLIEEVEILRQKIKVLEGERDQARSEVRVMGLQKREIDTRIQDFAFEKASQLQSMKAKEEEDTTPTPAKRFHQSREDHDCSKAPSRLELPVYSDFVAMKMTERHLDGEDFTLRDHINELYGDLKKSHDAASGPERAASPHEYGMSIQCLRMPTCRERWEETHC